MKNFPNGDISLLLLRIVGGGFMLTHGYGKCIKLINGDFTFADPLGIGSAPSLALTVFAEIFCALLVLFGLKTKWMSVPLAITMIVAVFVVHADHDFGRQEMGLMYLVIYIILILSGGGKYSLDRLIGK